MHAILRITILIAVVVSFPVRGAVINLAANLEASSEVPPALAPDAIGSAAMVLNTSTKEFGWLISFEELTGPAIAAHFHEASVGSSGRAILNLDTDSGALISGIGSSAGLFAGAKTLEAGDVNNILNGLWYINIHTDANPGGEIRGQVLSGTFNPVPIPAAVWLFGSGLLGLIGFAKRKSA